MSVCVKIVIKIEIAKLIKEIAISFLSISHSPSQNALDGAFVEGAHDGGRGSGSSEFAEEVETLLCFLG